MKTIFTVEFTVDDQGDEPIAPEIAMMDMLRDDAEEWVKWEVLREGEK